MALIGIGGIIALLIMISIYQPYSTDLRVFQPVVEIVPRVTGRVIDVPVQPNAPLQQGDVLFRIDPQPFQYQVDQSRAALAEAEQAVPQLQASLEAAQATVRKITAQRDLASLQLARAKDLLKRNVGAQADVDRWQAEFDIAEAGIAEAEARTEQARLAYASEIDGVNTKVAQLRAQLDQAELNLAETTVYAPAEGFVSFLSLRPGQIAASLPLRPVMSFIYSQEGVPVVSLRQNALRHIAPGDSAEVALDTYPGQIFPAKVVTVGRATGQGQLAPSGNLAVFSANDPRGLMPVRLELEDKEGVILGAGTAGAAAIYTSQMPATRIIRKVIIRMFTWMNYLFIS